MGRVGYQPTFSPFPAAGAAGSISLLHLSWGHPRRALPVILALWSPDFPHLQLFSLHPRLSDPVAEILYPIKHEMSNPLANSFGNVYTILHSVWTSLHFHHQYIKVLLSPHPSKHLSFVVSLIIVIPKCVKWYLLVLICISLRIVMLNTSLPTCGSRVCSL